jgi:Ankyrin repeats (3 copies)
MNPSSHELSPNARQPEAPYFPRWLLGIGLLAMPGSAALAARLIWEQTVWSWERGPQWVGFSLLHGALGAFAIPMFLSPPVLALWIVVSAAYVLWRLAKRRPLSRVSFMAMGLSIALIGTLLLPYGLWQRAFVGRLASGPHAGEFLTNAAAVGDLATVKAFLAHGTPVDVRNHSGQTGLHSAAVPGQTAVIKYLIAMGADVNAIDRSGDSPLEVATTQNHTEAAKYLADHGANLVRGSDEQRKKALCEIVQEDMESMRLSNRSRRSC